jgi:membrane fusion protein, heavy metal efflux system
MSTVVTAIPILIVDDDATLGNVLGRVLAREGRTILRAASAAQALEMAKQHRPRLALLDLCLPDGDGLALARQLLAAKNDLPLILMTAYPLRLQEQPGLAEHFTRILTKLMNLQELRQAVDAALAEPTAPALPTSRPPARGPVHSRPPEPAIPAVTGINAPAETIPPARPRYHKWAALAGSGFLAFAVFFLLPPLFGFPSLLALWTPTEPKEQVEHKAPLAVDLVNGMNHTLSVPAHVLGSLGIRKGKLESVATAEKPTQGRLLTMPGSTAQDDTRLSRVRVRFNAHVVDIRKTRPHPEMPDTSENREREILTGDPIKEGDTLAVLESVEVANMKSTLVNAWVQLYFDQDLLDRYEANPQAVPEINRLTAERNVRQDQTTIASSYLTLRIWGFSEEDLQDLRKEADELIQIRLKGKKDKGAKKEEDAAWAVKKDAWMRVELKAPRSGILVERNVSRGEFVADNTQPLFQIANVNSIVILANPAEDDLPVLLNEKKEKKQLLWTVHAVGLPPEGATAPISEISRFIDQNQHTAVIKGYLDNPDDRVRAGQFASATIELSPPEHTVEIPINALVDDGNQSIVFVVTKSEKDRLFVTMQRVIVTHRFDDTAWVLTDFKDLAPEKQRLSKVEKVQGLLEPRPLEKGARVITSGPLELKAALEDKEQGGEGK